VYRAGSGSGAMFVDKYGEQKSADTKSKTKTEQHCSSAGNDLLSQIRPQNVLA